VVERKIHAVVFDLDGTLIDSRDDIADAVNVALAASGRARLSTEEIAHYVGDGAKLLLSRAARLPPEDPGLDLLIAAFLDHYAQNATARTMLMPHAADALDVLGRDYQLALLTNKPRRTTEVILDALALWPRFRMVIAGGDLPQKKPDPLPLQHIAKELGTTPRALVMVGDGPQDVLAARAAGSLSVGIVGGFATREDLLAAQPDALVEDLGALVPWIRAQATSK
jgi:phosphoglycolate phosphatase